VPSLLRDNVVYWKTNGKINNDLQSSLLHLTKAAVSCLNSFSGHAITGSEKANRGARVQSTNRMLFLIERSLCFLEIASYFGDAVHYISSLGLVVQPHVVAYTQEPNWGEAVHNLKVCTFVFDSYWFTCMLAFKTWGGVCDVYWEMTVFFLLAAYTTLSLHCCQGRVPFSLTLLALLC